MSLPRRVATSVAKRKLPVAVAAAVVIAIALAAVFWTLGFFTGDEPLQEETAADSPSSSEIAGNYPTPAGTISPVTAVPSQPECTRQAESKETLQLTASDIEDAALTGVVQIITDIGAGSGFFAGQEGVVVTDSQVVEGSWLIRVRPATGETVKGELVGIDEELGVAYIEVADDQGFTTLPMGNSDDACVGDVAFAVGYTRDASSAGTHPSITQGTDLVQQGELHLDQRFTTLRSGRRSVD